MEQRVTVNRPAHELYQFWRDVSNLPLIIDHLLSVEERGTRSHWKARFPDNLLVEWDAEIIDDRPNELIVWRAAGGQSVDNAVAVSFQPAPGDRGTEVGFDFDYDPPGGIIGDIKTRLMGLDTRTIAQSALHRFKALIEAGEIPTIQGQPAARHNGNDH